MTGTIQLTVGGITYTVKGEGSEEYLHRMGDELENKLKSITRKNPTLSTTMVAILAALDFLEEAKNAQAEIAKLKDELSVALAGPHQLRIDES